MPYITDIYAREVLDSRGNPTVEVEVTTESGAYGKAIVPSGASTGEAEALELRDNDQNRFNGLGVLKAVSNVNDVIAPRLMGFDCREQLLIDNFLIELDGTKNKSNLGANALLAVSMACAKAAADYNRVPLYEYFGGFNAHILPTPMMNILNGGCHADWCIDFQEVMIIPAGFNSFKRCLQAGAEVFHTLKKILKDKGYNTSVGDEGGYAPKLSSNTEALDLVVSAITSAGYVAGKDIYLGLDVASSEFYDKNKKTYFLRSENKVFDNKGFINYLEKLVDSYPIITIEDGLSEEDWDGWVELTNRLGNKVQLVGDDLFTTNKERIEKGIMLHVANSVLIKINQIGTLSETFAAIETAKSNGYTTVISHRSGETEDTIICDIAVGTNAGQIKTGSMSRTDRIAKYNELLRIEDSLGSTAVFNGLKSFKR